MRRACVLLCTLTVLAAGCGDSGGLADTVADGGQPAGSGNSAAGADADGGDDSAATPGGGDTDGGLADPGDMIPAIERFDLDPSAVNPTTKVFYADVTATVSEVDDPSATCEYKLGLQIMILFDRDRVSTSYLPPPHLPSQGCRKSDSEGQNSFGAGELAGNTAEIVNGFGDTAETAGTVTYDAGANTVSGSLRERQQPKGGYFVFIDIDFTAACAINC